MGVKDSPEDEEEHSSGSENMSKELMSGQGLLFSYLCTLGDTTVPECNRNCMQSACSCKHVDLKAHQPT